MVPKFFTPFDPPTEKECPLEEHPDEGLVERSGYMETEELVNQLVQAGESLQAYREAEYQDGEVIPEDAPAGRYRSNLDTILETRRLKKKMAADHDAAVVKAEEELRALSMSKPEVKDGNL